LISGIKFSLGFAEGFAGCNNGNGGTGSHNVRVDLDMNQPASGGEEEEFPMGSVEEDEDERGGGGPHRPKKLRLSKEQSRLLEESFRLNHTLTPVSKLNPARHYLVPCPSTGNASSLLVYCQKDWHINTYAVYSIYVRAPKKILIRGIGRF
jgi:hypothetical protein